MEANAIERSNLFYNYIDSTDGYYSNKVEARYRSRMNIPFRICDNEELEKRFIAEAAAAGLLDLFPSMKGPAAVGCRASFYNAMTMEGVHALIKFMTSFREINV